MKAFLMSKRGAAVVFGVIVVAAAYRINVGGEASSTPADAPTAVADAPTAASWFLETQEGGAGTLERFSMPDAPDSVRVSITSLPGGAEGWYVKVVRAPYQIAAGTRYRVSFRARAEAPRPVGCAIGNNHEPWLAIGEYHEHVVTSDWTTFECPLTASADDSDARLFFDLGKSEAWVELTQIVVRDETNDRVLDAS